MVSKHATLGAGLALLMGCSVPHPPVADVAIQPAPAASTPVDDGRLAVLKGQPTQDPKQWARDLATRLGLQGEPSQEGTMVYVKDGNNSVMVHTDTGVAEYNTPYKWGGNSTGSAPDVEACKEVARQFLEKLAIARPAELAFYRVDEIGVSSSNGDNRLVERQIVYNRLWDGKLIQGPGSQLTVFVGEGGRVDGAFIDWPQLTEVKRVTVRDAASALALLPAAIARANERNHLDAAAGDFQVSQSTLGYVASLNPDGSRDILPAYAYAGSYPASKDTTRLYFVAASDDYPLR